MGDLLVDTASDLQEYDVSFTRINGIMSTYTRHFEVRAQRADVVTSLGQGWLCWRSDIRWSG